MSENNNLRLEPQAFRVTHSSVFSIALPMTLAYLSTPLLGLVDIAVIGQLNDATLIGGIAIGAIAFDILFTTCNFLRSGTTGLTAQALGRGERKEQVAILVRALLLAVCIGGAAIVLKAFFLDITLTYLGGSKATQNAARDYFLIRIYSAPFALMNYAVLGYILGLGWARAALVLQTFLNGTNILLSIVFVLGLEWGVIGVAWGTVIAEMITAFMGGVWLWSLLCHGQKPSWQRIFNKARFLRMIVLHRDIMIRSFSLLFAFTFFTAKSAIQGDLILASNAILVKLMILASYFLDGIATAAEQLTGRAIGARCRKAFEQTFRLTFIWSFILACFMSVFFFFLGPALVRFLTTNIEIHATVFLFMPWVVIFPIIGVLAFQMDGIFIGATWSKDMRNTMLLSLFLYIAIWSIAFPLFGNHGLWFAFTVFFTIRGLTLLWLFRIRMRTIFDNI